MAGNNAPGHRKSGGGPDFKPGHKIGAPKGNTNGAKPRMFYNALVDAVRVRDLTKKEKGILREVADKLLDMALGGDVMAMRELFDRLDGKVKQQVEHTTDPDHPIVLQHVMSRAAIEALIKAK